MTTRRATETTLRTRNLRKTTAAMLECSWYTLSLERKKHWFLWFYFYSYFFFSLDCTAFPCITVQYTHTLLFPTSLSHIHLPLFLSSFFFSPFPAVPSFTT
jgi:hypothetical protein